MRMYEVELGISDKDYLEEVADYLREASCVDVVSYTGELKHYKYRMY